MPNKVRVYQSIGGATPQQAGENARQMIEKYGYTALKMGIQAPGDMQEECAWNLPGMGGVSRRVPHRIVTAVLTGTSDLTDNLCDEGNFAGTLHIVREALPGQLTYTREPRVREPPGSQCPSSHCSRTP